MHLMLNTFRMDGFLSEQEVGQSTFILNLFLAGRERCLLHVGKHQSNIAYQK
jgi:hypothetical protein